MCLKLAGLSFVAAADYKYPLMQSARCMSSKRPLLTLTVLSSDWLARYLPIGSQATPLTKLVWPSKACTLWPFAGSHMMIRLSKLHSQSQQSQPHERVQQPWSAATE